MKLFQQQWDPVLISSEDRSSSCLNDSLCRNIGFTNFVVDLDRGHQLAFGMKTLSTQHTSFGNC